MKFIPRLATLALSALADLGRSLRSLQLSVARGLARWAAQWLPTALPAPVPIPIPIPIASDRGARRRRA